jgi:DNA-binding sugar fermentation-stimulating protein
MSLLLKLDGLVEGVIVKRPSKFIKSPYVADIRLGKNEVLGHTASLGCCGLADAGATIMMSASNNKKKEKEDDKLHCEYRVYLSVLLERDAETIVGIHPKLAEELVESALKSNLLSRLQNIKRYKR